MKLSEAIAANDPEAVAKGVRRIKNINRKLPDGGSTPLAYAAQKNADRVVPVLIEAGADPPTEQHASGHPLHAACWAGSDEALAALLDARRWDDKPLRDALEAAARQGQAGCLRLLFEKSGVEPTTEAVLAAAGSGRLAAMQELLSRGGDPETLDPKALKLGRGYDAIAALHTAAAQGYDKLINLMLEAGAEVNLRDSKGRTPLMHATLYHHTQRQGRVGHRSRVRDLADPDSGVRLLSGSLAAPPHARRTIRCLLDAGADATLTDDDGHTGMDILVQDNRAPTIDAWLERTLVAVGAPSVDRWPLDVVEAISQQNHDALRELIAQDRDVNFTTARGFTPMNQACRKGDPPAVALLLEAGADPDRPSDHETPLHAAVVGRSVEVVKYLLDAGADPNRPDPGVTEDEPRTPLALAKALRYREIAELLAERGATLAGHGKPRVEPGVHWWDDWELVVVKADVPTIAAALDPAGASTDLEPRDKTFASSGGGTFVLAQPAGMAWTSVLHASPVWRSLGDDFKRVAQRLAAACKAPAIYAAYADTAGAAEFVRYGPDGGVELEDRGADLESAEIEAALAEDAGRAPADWAVEIIREAEDADEDPPHSTQRLETLAQQENFALGWAYFSVEPKGKFEVEFPGFADEAIAAAAFVDAPAWA